MMRARLLSVLLAIIAFPLFGGIVRTPINLGFEEGAAGWSLPYAAGYVSAVVPEAHCGTSALKIWSTAEKPSDFAPLIQAVDAAPYRGKVVRLRAWVRSEVAPGGGAAQLWLRVDRPNNTMGFMDNMMNRPIRNASWQSYDIVGEVAADAKAIVFGAFLRGNGRMWVDDFSLTDVDSELAVLPPPSPTARSYLDKAIDIMEKNSIRRDKVDWPALRSHALLMARGGKEPADTYEAIRYAIGQLGDHHSFFLEAASGKQWRGEGGSQPRPELKLLEGGVGYIVIPSYSGGDPAAAAAYTDDVQGRIAAIDPAARCGWIVDLRNNQGGNMWPMLSGVGPILGEGEILSLIKPDNRFVVVYHDGRAVDRDSVTAKPAAGKSHVYTPERAPAVAC
jgi:carboxyl-terminal processing protease